VENAVALMPKKGKEGVEAEADDDYDPHKHRSVAHPTS
jgi:hypothetical protein